MNFNILANIDLIIFGGFLLVNLLAGLVYSQGVRDISDYAIGGRNFSTSTLVATLVATWIGANFISCTLIETYRQGLYIIIPNIGDALIFILIGTFFAPRMHEFLGKLSIAESMGHLFGPKVRLLTSIISLVTGIGVLGVQFKISAKLFEIFFGASGTYATLISGAIVILYSTFGGIRAVTFTDVVQFFTFGCLMPIVAIIAWDALSDQQAIWDTLSTHPNFNLSQVLDFRNPKFIKMFSLAIFFTLPEFSPSIFQRISMARSTSQAATSFKLAGLICLLIQMVVVSLAVFIMADNPNLDPDNLLNHILNRYAYTGLKGMIAVGIMAMIMSSADSLINSMSVIFAHDVCKPLNFSWSRNELLISRSFAILSGCSAMYFALQYTSLLELCLACYGVYFAVITMPFILAIFGFRSTGLSVLIGMFAGAISLAAFTLYMSPEVADLVEPFVPAMLVNIAFLFGSHYLLRQEGGWVGIKPSAQFDAFKQERKESRRRMVEGILNFSFVDFSKKNMPEQSTFSYFGIFSIISICVAMFSLGNDVRNLHTGLTNFLYTSVVMISFYLIAYPIWPRFFRKDTFSAIFWMLSVCYVAVFVPTTFVLISSLDPMQLILLLLNIVAVSVMFRWSASLFSVAAGSLASTYFVKYFVDSIDLNFASMQFKMTYFFLLLSSVLITFMKPNQQKSEKNSRLLSDVSIQLKNLSEQTLNLLIMKQEFINNLNHEIRTPVNHIGLGAVALHENQKSIAEQELKDNIEMVYSGYRRLQEYIGNILDLSSLSTEKVLLNCQSVDLSKLVLNILDEYKQLYLDNPEVSLKHNLEEANMHVYCDPEKISQAVKYLLQNAITFTQRGVIELKIEECEHKSPGLRGVKLSITDEGIGVPEEELSYIFGPFVQSSYTKSIAGGKGLGLALCQRIVELHGGQVWAENNKNKPGATFSFIIPTSNGSN